MSSIEATLVVPMTMIFQNIVSLFRNRNRKEQGLYHAHTVLQYSKKRAIFSGTIAVYIFACSWISLKYQCIFEKKIQPLLEAQQHYLANEEMQSRKIKINIYFLKFPYLVVPFARWWKTRWNFKNIFSLQLFSIFSKLLLLTTRCDGLTIYVNVRYWQAEARAASRRRGPFLLL